MLKTYALTLLALFACAKSESMPETRTATRSISEMHCPAMPANCKEATRVSRRCGIHQILVKPCNNIEPKSVFVYCEEDADGGNPWTIIQRRSSDQINFTRNWEDYKNGFGNLYNDFFIGLELLHAITHTRLHELWIQMENFENHTECVYFDSFAIGNEEQQYALNVLGDFEGYIPDALRYHEGMKFSTYDRDNDAHRHDHCAEHYKGGWWYNQCLHSNLNGLYLSETVPHGTFGQGINWIGIASLKHSLRYVHMAIRPVE